MKPLIVANWKMNPLNLAQAKRLFNSVKRGLKNIKKAEVVICPPFVFISNFQNLSSNNLKLGAQNLFWEEIGAYTGEISGAMLKNIKCQYVIVGHSERRRYFGENEEMINKKLKAALELKLFPILCVGETQNEREKGETESILKKQIEGALKKISRQKIEKLKLFIAYEPVWAIGTGKPCDFEEAQKMGLVIKKIISKIYNSINFAQKIPILYGGSVNSRNGIGYIKEAGLQGLLVGGASLNAKEFVNLIRKIC